MPDLVGPLLNPETVGLLRLVRLVKQAKFHSCSIFGKRREVHPRAVSSPSQRIGATQQDPYLVSSRSCEERLAFLEVIK